MFLRHADKIFLTLTVALVVIGYLTFSSASLGLLEKTQISVQSVLAKQFFVGIVGGGIALLFASTLHYRFWRKYAIYIFISVVLFACLVFIPGLAFEHNGATRWLSIAGFTIQPAEFLKFGYVIYIATWLSGVRTEINSWRLSLIPFGIVSGIVGVIMFLQRDTDGLVVMLSAGLAMLLVAGVRMRVLAIMIVIAVLGVGAIMVARPYIVDRLVTFYSGDVDTLNNGWQINQSLIAVGSGEMTGRGYGQSVQKFGHLPEATSDSIFSVYAEEFGFVGSTFLVVLFLLFALRGYRIATHAKDLFGMLLVTGIITMIMVQVFLNIAAMLRLIPLSGMTLPLISHGGTSLLMTLAALGVVLNVSKFQRKI